MWVVLSAISARRVCRCVCLVYTIRILYCFVGQAQQCSADTHAWDCRRLVVITCLIAGVSDIYKNREREREKHLAGQTLHGTWAFAHGGSRFCTTVSIHLLLFFFNMSQFDNMKTYSDIVSLCPLGYITGTCLLVRVCLTCELSTYDLHKASLLRAKQKMYNCLSLRTDSWAECFATNLYIWIHLLLSSQVSAQHLAWQNPPSANSPLSKAALLKIFLNDNLNFGFKTGKNFANSSNCRPFSFL